MEAGSQFLAEHGGTVLFWGVFIEQIGLPIPALPLLVAAGALAGQGAMTLTSALTLPVAASLAADLLWYSLGRSQGGRVLGWLCKISLEPDSCVRRMEGLFFRHGIRSVLVAKFVPGLSTVAPPLAGIFGMGLGAFLFYDGLGAIIWAASGTALGYLFSAQLDRLLGGLARTGGLLMAIIGGGLAAYVGYKFARRRRFLRQLRMARITVDELKGRMDAGDPPAIIDVRHRLDLDANAQMIPGALHIMLEEIGHRHHEIPRDRDVVLYCACPNEVSSARTALALMKNGVHRVRPLEGGIDAWKERQYPLELRAPALPDGGLTR